MFVTDDEIDVWYPYRNALEYFLGESYTVAPPLSNPAPRPPSPPTSPAPPEPERCFEPSLFGRSENPAAYYLDSDGYKAIWESYKRPRSSVWAKLCPNTYKLASALFDGLTQRRVWGRQIDFKQWTTYTDGLRRRNVRWPDSRIELIDVLNSLGNPDRYAVGTTDRRISDDYANCEWINPSGSIGVSRICIDVDIDSAYNLADIEMVKEELQAEQAALTNFGLPAYWMRTGGRGHQIIIPVPRMTRSLASLLTLMIRYLLNLVKHPCAKIDKGNIASIMRMPLGRHAYTEKVAWMIDPEFATNLPLDQQVETCIRAWRYQSGSCEWLESELEHLEIEIEAVYPDTGVDVGAGVADKFVEMLLFGELGAIPQHFALVKRFRAACNALVSCPSTTVIYRVTVSESEVEKHSVVPDSIDKGSNDSEISPAAADAHQPTDKQPLANQHRRRVGKGWAKSVVEAGFKEGEFYHWSHSNGQNGIGAAIIVCDGDRDAAKDLLLSMSATVPVDDENMQARARWINWAVERNNVNLYSDTADLRQHKEIAGVITAKESLIAVRLVDKLMSIKGRRRINAKGVLTLTHLIELAQMHLRHSTTADEIAISVRTFEAEIAARWPDEKTTQMDVHRKLTAITEGENCIVSVLKPVNSARSAYDARRYEWGADYLEIAAEIERESLSVQDANQEIASLRIAV